MTSCTGKNIANGVLSGITLVCGIILSAVTATLIKYVIETAGSANGLSFNNEAVALSSTPLWAVGFTYMIPGVVGVIAAFVRAKTMYIAQMVLMIIVLIIMGVLFIMSIIFMAVFTSIKCQTVGGACVCTSGLSTDSVSVSGNCGGYGSMEDFAKGCIAMIVFGWISCLAATILAGIIACRREESRGGVVIQQPNQTMNMNYVQSNQPDPEYAYNNQGGKF